MKQKNLVLMVVAVGCGLVAAFLTSQMSAKQPAVDKVDVIVAAQDLQVGTSYTKDELGKILKRKSIARDAVPPGIIEAEEELLEKRLTRNIRADEMINKGDLSKGVIVSIPAGMKMVSLPINLQSAVHGFVMPGSKVDVLASVTLSNKVRVLPLLVNMLVLAVDANIAPPQQGVSVQAVSTVSFAVNDKQALLIQLAKARHCEMTLLLRNREDQENDTDKGYKIDEVVKLLQHGEISEPGDAESTTKRDKADTTPGSPTPTPAPAPRIETVKVPAAIDEIPAGTPITNDLIAEKFKLVELPKDLAADAVTDLAALAEDKQVLRTGLGKGQWVTKSLFGKADPKPAPREGDNLPKPGPTEDRKVREVAVHGAGGTKIYRYEETAPGQWKLLGEANPNKSDTPKTPEKVD